MALELLVVLMPIFISAQSDLYSFTENHMGTAFTISIYSTKHDAVFHAAKAFEEIKKIDRIFSNYDAQSELSSINRNSSWQYVSEEMAELIIFSEKLRKQSKGAFDIRIGKSIDVWKKAIKENKFPDTSQIKALQKNKLNIKIRKAKDYYKIKINANTKLDFGGIAKGYAVDKVFDYLKKNGIVIFLIDGGGDLRMADCPPDREGWNIMISSDGENTFRKLKNCAIATSGSQFQHIIYDGKKYSHIIDPTTKIGCTKDKKVSILANTCTVADALSTTFSISGHYQKLLKYYYFRSFIKQNGIVLIQDF